MTHLTTFGLWKVKINNGHWKKNSHKEIMQNIGRSIENIERSIQTSRHLLILLSKDLQMFCPEFIEKSKIFLVM